MLISVHLPKTAGSSFRSSLENHFGDGMLSDYSDRPTNQASFARNIAAMKAALLQRNLETSPECIHGHFMPLKYRWLITAERKTFVVWFRDPIERLASHYHYWNRDYDPDTAGILRRKVVEEGWNLERFCFSSEMRNLYSKLLWGFPVSRFDFIGVTENYESDLNYFSANFLGNKVAAKEANVNPRKAAGRYIENGNLRSRLERFHEKDVRLYQRALSSYNERVRSQSD